MKKNTLEITFLFLTKPFVILTFLLVSITIQAQNGSIVGRVTDVFSNEPLIGASVLVTGSTMGSASDFDGNYKISGLKPGIYSLTISYISYKTLLKKSVIVESGKQTILDIMLESADIALKEIEVVAKANRESENILLMEQKRSLLAIQAVGAKEMSRKGISNAEAAVSQVSGISKQEGVKNVFVRGLGDRYNHTTLNGLPIPSGDPEYKNISLDYFGADIIKNIGVSKVFSSKNYSDVGGAVIDISSKELAGDKELNLDLSVGLNNQTINADFLKMDGVGYWGFSNTKQPVNNYKSIWGFNSSLDPSSVSLPLNYSYGLSGGKNYKIGENSNPLSFYIVATYSSKYAYTKERVVNTGSTGVIDADMDGHKFSQNINQLVLLNINMELNKKHQIDYNFMLVHDNSQYVGQYIGLNSGSYQGTGQLDQYNGEGFLRRQQSNDNLLMVNQFISDWELSEKHKLGAAVAYNYERGIEPDRRINNLFRLNSTDYELLAGTGMQMRNFSTLWEHDLNAKFELTRKLAQKFKNDISSVHIGYKGRFLTDNFNASEYSMTAVVGETQTLENLMFDSWYNQQNLVDNKFSMYNKIVSTYNVLKLINSGYAEMDYQFNPKWSFNLGLNVDQIYLSVDYDVKSGNVAKDRVTKSYLYILPSFNIKYDINDRNTVRLGLSKTYTLPQSKEISPYQYIGINFKSQGNPDLTPSQNYNLDLKWDYYLTPSELISATGFYKIIDNPIARIEVNNSGGYLTYKNLGGDSPVNDAMVAGFETEIRKNIFNRANSSEEKTNRLTAGLSASYIYSKVKVISLPNTPDKDSQLEGAAPYIINFDLSHNYSHKVFSLNNSLVFNYFSDRVYTIGTTGFQDVIEQGVPTLSFVSSAKLNRHLEIKLKAKNILDPTFRLTRQGNAGGNNVVLNEYKKGTNINLGVSYIF
ncbi:MAG: TonB-dependent receptor [Paludibacteraceae bacterium]